MTIRPSAPTHASHAVSMWCSGYNNESTTTVPKMRQLFTSKTGFEIWYLFLRNATSKWLIPFFVKSR